MSKKRLYFLRVEGQRVPVTEEVYREYYRLGRRERYIEERDAACGKVLYSNMDTADMLGEETIPDMEAGSVEHIAVDSAMADKLRLCLKYLTADERELIEALFYKGYSERGWADISGIPRKTIGDRRARILGKLKKYLENR